MLCPPGMSEKPHGALVLSLLLPFPDHSEDVPVGCDQQKAPRLPVSRSLKESSSRQAPSDEMDPEEFKIKAENVDY